MHRSKRKLWVCRIFFNKTFNSVNNTSDNITQVCLFLLPKNWIMRSLWTWRNRRSFQPRGGIIVKGSLRWVHRFSRCISMSFLMQDLGCTGLYAHDTLLVFIGPCVSELPGLILRPFRYLLVLLMPKFKERIGTCSIKLGVSAVEERRTWRCSV